MQPRRADPLQLPALRVLVEAPPKEAAHGAARVRWPRARGVTVSLCGARVDDELLRGQDEPRALKECDALRTRVHAAVGGGDDGEQHVEDDELHHRHVDFAEQEHLPREVSVESNRM